MADHDAAPDPIDQAYAQAEAALSDDAARSARRARVLSAVANQPAAPPATVRPAWRRGGWLAAASVAGLALFITLRTFQPGPPQPQPARAPRTPGAVAPGAPSVPSPAPPTKITAAPIKPPTVLPAAPPVAAPFAPAPQAFPGAPTSPTPPPPPPPPPPPLPPPPPPPQAAREEPSSQAEISDLVVTAEKRRASGPSATAAQSAPAAALASPSKGAALDQAARLRAASAAGRTAEVEALLAQGATVDAPDADGNTALMKSVQADHPAVAALLRRHGASLDHRNRAGQNARDLAARVGDANLDEALGLAP